jgi:hypothetical protein
MEITNRYEVDQGQFSVEIKMYKVGGDVHDFMGETIAVFHFDDEDPQSVNKALQRAHIFVEAIKKANPTS